MKLHVSQGLVVVGLTMGMAACGPKLQSVSEQDGSASQDPSRRETVTVGVSLNESATGFALAGVTSYSMSLGGCASGYTIASITQSSPNIDLYRYDQNCLVKLNSFEINGYTYIPSGDDPFTSWLANDSAVFESAANPAEKFAVKVVNQLGNPIGTTDSVSYAFTQWVKGQDKQIAKNVVGESHSISVTGIDAADVTIAGVAMTGMAAGGAGEFRFNLECASNVTGTGAATACGTNQLTTLKYVLVQDNTANGTLTQAAAAALFVSAGTTVGTTDILPLGDADAPKGGFKANATGPTAMHQNPNMLLVIQSGGANGSYKYFNVDVETLAITP